MDLLLDSEESGGASAMNTRIDVYLLPDYYGNTAHAGKSHIGVPRRKLGTINNSDDLESAVRKFASEPGAYYAELRAGREVLDSGVFPLQPRAQNIALDLSPASEPPQDALGLVLQQMSQRLERLESGSIAARPPNKVRLRRAAATHEAEPIQQPVFLELLERERARDREVLELKIENAKLQLRQEVAREDNSAPDTLSKLLLGALESKLTSGDADTTDRLIDRVLYGESEQRSWVADLMEHSDKILPLLGGALGALMPQAPPPQPYAQPAPAPLHQPAPQQQRPPQRQASPRQVPTPAPEATAQAAPQPPTFETESDTVITNLLLDMEKNRGVKSSARDIVSLMKDFPAETQMLATLFEQPSETILQVLAGRIPSCASIVGKPESAAWLDRLKVEIKTRQQKAANVAPVVPDASEAMAQAKTA